MKKIQQFYDLLIYNYNIYSVLVNQDKNIMRKFSIFQKRGESTPHTGVTSSKKYRPDIGIKLVAHINNQFDNRY